MWFFFCVIKKVFPSIKGCLNTTFHRAQEIYLRVTRKRSHQPTGFSGAEHRHPGADKHKIVMTLAFLLCQWGNSEIVATISVSGRLCSFRELIIKMLKKIHPSKTLSHHEISSSGSFLSLSPALVMGITKSTYFFYWKTKCIDSTWSRSLQLLKIRQKIFYSFMIQMLRV